MTTTAMSSNRPYLLRAMFEWINDNGLTPYLLVDATAPGVSVPPASIKDGRVVLSIAARAVAQLDIGTERVTFLARFNGVSHSTVKKGYLCLESEGAPIHFRNIRILELPPGITTPEQTAPVVGK